MKISRSYPRRQVEAEIRWLNKEIDNVKKQMEKRPSKIRHLNDLLRQKREREDLL